MGAGDMLKSAGNLATTGGVSTLNPWLAGAGLVMQGIGSGLTASQEEEERKRKEKFEREQFDWLKKTDTKKLEQQQQQLGQNTIQGMRSNFKDALYRSLTMY